MCAGLPRGLNFNSYTDPILIQNAVQFHHKISIPTKPANQLKPLTTIYHNKIKSWSRDLDMSIFDPILCRILQLLVKYNSKINCLAKFKNQQWHYLMFKAFLLDLTSIQKSHGDWSQSPYPSHTIIPLPMGIPYPRQPWLNISEWLIRITHRERRSLFRKIRCCVRKYLSNVLVPWTTFRLRRNTINSSRVVRAT